MKVEEFFNKEDEEIVSFDFSDEVLRNKRVRGDKYKALNEEYLNKNIDIFRKYILYKKDFNKCDPDTNGGLLKDIYEEVWDDKIDNKILNSCSSNNKTKYYSDTMTSVQNLLSNYYISLCSDEWDDYKKEHSDVQYFSIEIFKEMFENDKKYPKFKKAFENEKVREFVKHYHTLGNYIPVPYGFNKARSGSFASHDMWDITLEKIKEYYHIRKQSKDISKSLEVILELLHMKDTINKTINWLDSFGTWENFVDKNFLMENDKNKNYVDKSYNIIKLANHHFSDSQIKSDEYLKYFEELTNIIKGRTLIIKEYYKSKLNN